jgi:serine/threonine protein kinase
MPPQSERWWVKIGDFGISKRVKNEDTAFRTQTGTPYFQAPEIQGFIDDGNESSEYSNAVDMWSLGYVVYYIAARKVPFLTPRDTGRFCQRILLFPEELLATRISEAGIGFVKYLLIPEPASRLSAENALKDAWIIMSSLTDGRKVEPTASSTGSKMATEIAGPARDSSSSQNYNLHKTIRPKQASVYSRHGLSSALNTSTLHTPAQTLPASNPPPISYFNPGSELSDSWSTQVQIPTYKPLNSVAMTTKTVSPTPKTLHLSSISELRIPRY